MTNWLVPVLWIIGDLYMHYYLCIECREKMAEFAAIAKMGMKDMPGRTTIAVILVLALIEVLTFAWPVIGLIDVGGSIYKFIKGDKT